MVVDNIPKSPKTIAGLDFLALLVSASIVGNRHLIQVRSGLSNQGGDLDLHTEATTRERHGGDERGPKGLIARLNVGEIHIREQIGEKGQQLIGEIMVKIEVTGCLFDAKT
jgi:hypothetical protein